MLDEIVRGPVPTLAETELVLTGPIIQTLLARAHEIVTEVVIHNTSVGFVEVDIYTTIASALGAGIVWGLKVGE